MAPEGFMNKFLIISWYSEVLESWRRWLGSWQDVVQGMDTWLELGLMWKSLILLTLQSVTKRGKDLVLNMA